MGDVLKVGFYILLFLPGFIFVQSRDYHLLRESKGQLEKTLEVVLWSAALWFVACTVPVFYWEGPRERTLARVQAVLQSDTPSATPLMTAVINRDGAWFLLRVCVASWALANLWGLLRKARRVDAVITFFTGRDWYPSVAYRFFRENMDRLVVIKTEGGSYMGILHGAPDTASDQHIILQKPAFMPEGPNQQPEPLELVETLLIRYEDFEQIQALKPELVTPAATSWRDVAALFLPVGMAQLSWRAGRRGWAWVSTVARRVDGVLRDAWK